ncbi:MAG: zf-HC2 domain-containing protein [Candidatus Aminicenantales bacterium]
MKKCPFEEQIDHYLLNRLEGEEKDIFEEHYFNCPVCFQKMQEKDEIIAAIKSRGAWIFKEEPSAQKKELVPSFERVFSLFTPRQWATVAIVASLVLITVFGVLPQLRKSMPQFVLNDHEVVRGKTLSLISPVIDVSTVPAYFEWTKLGENIEYRISIYNEKLLWTTTTPENRIALPEEVQKLMTAGQKYSWQVRAFSDKGTLIAVSSRVHFQIKPTE